MPTPKPSQYMRYDLSKEEELQAGVFSHLQKCYLSNMMLDATDQKNNLDLDVNNPREFIQQEAFLKGQISVLRMLIDNSDVCMNELERMRREETENKQSQE